MAENLFLLFINTVPAITRVTRTITPMATPAFSPPDIWEDDVSNIDAIWLISPGFASLHILVSPTLTQERSPSVITATVFVAIMLPMGGLVNGGRRIGINWPPVNTPDWTQYSIWQPSLMAARCWLNWGGQRFWPIARGLPDWQLKKPAKGTENLVPAS